MEPSPKAEHVPVPRQVRSSDSSDTVRFVPTPCTRSLGLFAIGVIFAATVQAGFIYPDFSSSSGLILGGAATTAGNILRLTPDLTYQVGSAWYSAQQNVAQGFSSSFTFQLTASGPIADGIWFVIQNDNLADVSPVNGIPNSIAVEFDTFQNVWDPNGNHVAFQSCGTNPNTTKHDTGCTLAINSVLPVTLADGAIHSAIVTYTPGTLALTLDGIPTLSTTVDLNTLLNLNSGSAWAGFITSTGAFSENNDIRNWSFASATPEPSTVSTALWGLLALCGVHTLQSKGRIIPS
jgi:hypothetical protein